RTEGAREENLRLGLEASERATALNPRLPDAYKAKSLVLLGMGNLHEARAALEKALELNPRFTPALINLGVSAVGTGDLAGAERWDEKANPRAEYLAVSNRLAGSRPNRRLAHEGSYQRGVVNDYRTG